MAGNFAGQILSTPVQIAATGAVVAGVPGEKIRVLAAFLNSAGAVNALFQSGLASPTVQLSGFLYMTANQNRVELPFNEYGWFDTVAGDALALALSAGVQIGGVILYTLVP